MKDWTVAVFLAGDNDLERCANADLLEMQQVGSSDRVDAVVEFDSRKTGTVRYHVERGRLAPLGDPLPETNTGDPAVLTRFVRWARETYPARHTLLVMWNHGSGWVDIPADFDWANIRGGADGHELKHALFSTTVRKAHAGAKDRALALDATSRDFLDNDELKDGLAQALEGGKLDVLGLDACLMSMVEIGYQLRDQAHYMVGSQEIEPGYGWPYKPILRSLCQNPELAPRALSELIVTSYGQAGTKLRGATKYTQSAMDLEQMGSTAALIKRLAGLLRSSYPKQILVRQAVHEATRTQRGAKRFGSRDCVDLYDWLSLLRRAYTGPDGELEAAADDLLAHLEMGAEKGLVVASSAEVGDDRKRVHGVSIYLPVRTSLGGGAYSELYESLDLAKTGWGKFAKAVNKELK